MIRIPRPLRVGLILTERCDASCAHCWFSCGPEKTVTMNRYDAQDYIDKASRAGAERLSLTGGEPMLYPSIVENLVTYASGCGMRTELVTNCNWAESHEKVRGTLMRLRGAGLDVVNISADDFHQAFIPFERVANVYNAAKELGFKIVVLSALSKGDRGLADVAAVLGDPLPPLGEAEDSQVIGIESGFTPIGRGASLSKSAWYPDASPLTGGCGGVLRDLGIKPSGEVLPCCSATATVPGFGLGNLDDWDLNELLEKAWQSEIFKVLAEKGPMGLVKGSLKGSYVNRCHLCSEVVADLLEG